MGDGTIAKPLTHKDVLRLIEENGGTANRLDLSRKHFVNGIDLSELDLKGADLTGAHLEGANLRDAHFEEAKLGFAHLEKSNLKYAHLEETELWETHLEEANLGSAHLEGADLRLAYLERAQLVEAHFEKAFLRKAHLEGAYLIDNHVEGADFSSAYLEGAYLHGTQFWVDTRLEAVNWGDYILGEEKSRQFDKAVNAYQQLKQWHTTAGLHDIAAKFYYREKEASRKSLTWRSKSSFRHRLSLELSYLVFGHGEGWKRLLFWVAGFILLFALIYFAFDETRQWQYFGDYIYFSTVSFTALGYGSWLHVTNNWIKGIGAFESFIGVFSMALLLVTFVRKWTR